MWYQHVSSFSTFWYTRYLNISLSMHLKNEHIIFIQYMGPSWQWSYGSWICNYLNNQCLSPLMLWVRISIRARCTTLYDKVCRWLATGRCFFPGSPVSSTNNTDRHDIAEILLKVALNTIKPNSYLFNIWAKTC
jgi:hypothetical protein